MATDFPGRILVVDDNPATRYATARVLKHAGHAVLEASTGTSAVAIASQEPIDLAVLDVDLPDFDGYEVCRRIRAMPSTRRIRVIHLSASFVDNSHRVQGFEAGADAFLTQPVEPAVLNATVGALLRTRAIEIELEQSLRSERVAREEAERANRAKDEFLATLSHELRSPLTAIIGWAEVARLKSADVPELLHPLQVITRNARLQAQLISDLLDVSRITSGNLRLDIEPLSLTELVNSAVESAMGFAAEKHVKLERSLDDSDETMVLGDAGRIQQIVTNLLSNAIKFSSPEGRVLISLGQHAGSAQIVVQDEGRGISPSVLERIFDRFWQEDTSSRRSYSGLGLGLAIVKHLTEMHGGSVRAESDGEGKGARFTVTLPIAPVDAASALRAAPDDAVSIRDNGTTDLTGLRVLIVDDDHDGRKWVRYVVTEAGAEAIDVSDVGQAIAEVERFAPHVIISDLAMPDRDGFDLLEYLRKNGHTPAKLPAIALSAFASTDDKHRALDASFQCFISKPPDKDELLQAISAFAV